MRLKVWVVTEYYGPRAATPPHVFAVEQNAISHRHRFGGVLTSIEVELGLLAILFGQGGVRELVGYGPIVECLNDVLVINDDATDDNSTMVLRSPLGAIIGHAVVQNISAQETLIDLHYLIAQLTARAAEDRAHDHHQAHDHPRPV